MELKKINNKKTPKNKKHLAVEATVCHGVSPSPPFCPKSMSKILT